MGWSTGPRLSWGVTGLEGPIDPMGGGVRVGWLKLLGSPGQGVDTGLEESIGPICGVVQALVGEP